MVVPFFFSNQNSLKEASIETVDTLLKNIRQTIEIRDLQDTKSWIELYFEALTKSGHLSKIYVKYTFTEIVKYIFESLGQHSVSNMQKMAEKVYNTHNLQELKDILISFIEEIEKKYGLKRYES